MQTYTHFLFALALSKPLDNFLSVSSTSSNISLKWWQRLPPFRRSAVLFGSILPDLPLIVTTIVFMLIDKLFDKDLVHQLFHDWYFHNIWIESEHNLFHSQVTLLCMMVLVLLVYRQLFVWQQQRRCPAVADTGSQPDAGCCCWWWWCPSSLSLSSWIFWMLLSAWFHATCDIPVHHDDGPLVFFPLSTSYRFHSPISYWDPSYHGREFAICEHIVDGIIIIHQCYRCCWYYKYRVYNQPIEQANQGDHDDDDDHLEDNTHENSLSSLEQGDLELTTALVEMI